MKATAHMTDEQLAMARRRAREKALEAIREARRAVVTAASDVSLWCDNVSQVVERDMGLGPGDLTIDQRIANEEYAAALHFVGPLGELAAQLQKVHDDLVLLRCPACEQDARRPGEAIRQELNGDLVCHRCGCVVAPAPEASS